MSTYFLHNNLFQVLLVFVPGTQLATLKILKYLVPTAQLLDSVLLFVHSMSNYTASKEACSKANG